MADVWVNAFTVVQRSKWNDEMAAKIGYAVLEALLSRWNENRDKEPGEGIEGLLEPNTSFNTTITVNTN